MEKADFAANLAAVSRELCATILCGPEEEVFRRHTAVNESAVAI